jgi:hypothetical protein
VFDQRAARCTKMRGETIGMPLNGLSTSKSVFPATIKIGVTIHRQFQEFIVRWITTRHATIRSTIVTGSAASSFVSQSYAAGATKVEK